MSGNTRKNQVTRLVTLRHRSIMSGALNLGAYAPGRMASLDPSSSWLYGLRLRPGWFSGFRSAWRPGYRAGWAGFHGSWLAPFLLQGVVSAGQPCARACSRLIAVVIWAAHGQQAARRSRRRLPPRTSRAGSGE